MYVVSPKNQGIIAYINNVTVCEKNQTKFHDTNLLKIHEWLSTSVTSRWTL